MIIITFNLTLYKSAHEGYMIVPIQLVCLITSSSLHRSHRSYVSMRRRMHPSIHV